MRVLSLFSITTLLLPACLGWVQPIPLTKTRSSILAATHKDTFDEINRELNELGNDIQSQISAGKQDLDALELRRQLDSTREQLLASQLKVKELESKLRESHEKYEDLKVVFKVTDREVLLEQRNRKKELNDARFLLRSLIQLMRHRIGNLFKMATQPRWRLHARWVRKDSKAKKED